MKASAILLIALSVSVPAKAQSKPSSGSGSAPAAPTFTLALRERTNVTQWFAAAPPAELYAHQDFLLRLSLGQRLKHFDYLVELGQSAELALPRDAVAPIAAQGQLGQGGTYFAANGNNVNPAAASFRQGFLRYHSHSEASTLRAGRFEFFDGQEAASRNNTLLWLQSNRIAQRLVGNFGFSNGQRSFDGLDASTGGKDWNLTAMAGRATQGVFNMNANPELDVDIQYLAYTHSFARQHIVARGFGLGYHDGRTGLTKTDNRPAAVRALDHRNIRIGTYGGNLLAAAPAGKQTLDLLIWGAGQFGSWGLLDHSAAAVAVEGGLRLNTVKTSPWLRVGYDRSTGDNNSADGTHNTFFQVLPTPRIYARFPFFNLMNSTDSFVQLIDKPGKKLDLRTDLHFLRLTAASDLWYQGGGAFDRKVFGYTGRPANGHSSFSSLYDLSADYAINKQVSINLYYAHVFGKSVVAAIYPAAHTADYGYMELVYKLQHPLARSAAH